MPELPDIEAYLGALRTRIGGERLTKIRIASPFLLRTAEPPLSSAEDHVVRELRRVGKRIAFGFDNDLWLVLHLMIAGRLHWRPPGAKLGGRQNLAAFDFPAGSLVLTEAGSKRRASLQLVAGEDALASVDPGASMSLPPIWPRFARRFRRRTAPSSARSPIRDFSAASAMRTPMRFCTPRSCRRLR